MPGLQCREGWVMVSAVFSGFVFMLGGEWGRHDINQSPRP